MVRKNKKKDEEELYIPKFDKISKLKAYQDFIIYPEKDDFRYGFVLQVANEEGELLGSDVWCLTPKGLIWSKKLDDIGEYMVYNSGQINAEILRCFVDFSEDIKLPNINCDDKEMLKKIILWYKLCKKITSANLNIESDLLNLPFIQEFLNKLEEIEVEIEEKLNMSTENVDEEEIISTKNVDDVSNIENIISTKNVDEE